VTYLLPALDEPTRYRTPEESGMKMDLHTIHASTALLCNSIGVAAPEINSLCCAAAGTIAPLSANAEALIPHEKLRGATLADATLIAQNRPSAQPVMGYTHPSRATNALTANDSQMMGMQTQSHAIITLEKPCGKRFTPRQLKN